MRRTDAGLTTPTEFKALFGITPQMCPPVYRFILRKIRNKEVEDQYRNYHHVYLLYGLRMLKSKDTLHSLAIFFKRSRMTYDKWAKFTIKMIATMSFKLVRNV